MSWPPTPLAVDPHPVRRLDVLFDELAELTGQRNAVDARIVDIVAEIERDGLWGNTGCRSITELIAWKTGCSPRNAHAIAAIAHRIDAFPRLVEQFREGALSLDQVGVIAEKAADGSDDHYADLAQFATVAQLQKAVRLEPQPEPQPDATPEPEPKRSVTRTDSRDGRHTTYTIIVPKVDAAKVDAALDAHHDALHSRWRRERETTPAAIPGPGYPTLDPTPPPPTLADAFMSVVEAGWDVEAARRPHGQHTTVIAHLDVEEKLAALHLGPLLSDAERRYLLCDATCEVWFERDGRPIGVGRATRTVNRRLRRALERRDHGTCVVPGCGANVCSPVASLALDGLHAHHLVHWEDGGPTDLDNLVLVCPYHHRMHHRGQLTLTGPADRLVVTDEYGRPITNSSLARPPTKPPPTVAPYKGPTGERAQWWWYTPFEPKPPTTN